MPGFEPGNGGIKIRCLTTWLHPTRARGKPTEVASVAGTIVSRLQPGNGARQCASHPSTDETHHACEAPTHCCLLHEEPRKNRHRETLAVRYPGRYNPPFPDARQGARESLNAADGRAERSAAW